jgi:hypothetical protein
MEFPYGFKLGRSSAGLGLGLVLKMRRNQMIGLNTVVSFTLPNTILKYTMNMVFGILICLVCLKLPLK